MNKLKCKDPECIELERIDDENIELMLYVEESETTQYHINENGTLRLYDADSGGQVIWLMCPCCDSKYEFDQDYFEIQKCSKLGFDIAEEDNFKISKVKESWEK